MARHGKNIYKKDTDEKTLERQILRLIPGLPKYAEKFVNRLEHFDGSEPRTLIAALKGDFQALAKTLHGREPRVGRLLYQLFGRHLAPLIIRQQVMQVAALAKQEAKADPRYALLLKLMHQVDAQGPLLSVVVSLRHGDPESTFDPQCRPLQFLQEAERKTGEARATAVLHALAVTTEALYRPYLITIWQLSYLKEGKLPPTPPDTGALLQVACQRLSGYPELLEPDAVWMRNAAVHQHYEYLVGADALVLWDKNRPRTEVRVNDLLAMVQRMYRISGITIARVSQLYMFRELFINTGLLDTIVECLPLALSGNQMKIAAAEQIVMAKAETITQPIQIFFVTHGS